MNIAPPEPDQGSISVIVRRIIVGPRVRCYLSGSSLFQQDENHGYGVTGNELRNIILAHSSREHVPLTAAQVDVLLDHAEMMKIGALDDASWCSSARNDLAAARRLLRQIDAS